MATAICKHCGKEFEYTPKTRMLIQGVIRTYRRTVCGDVCNREINRIAVERYGHSVEGINKRRKNRSSEKYKRKKKKYRESEEGKKVIEKWYQSENAKKKRKEYEQQPEMKRKRKIYRQSSVGKKTSKNYRHLIRRRLTDNYIKGLLTNKNPKGARDTQNITPELIELKREQLILYREMRGIRKLLNGSA